MGEFIYDATGNTSPFVKKYGIGATFSAAGILAENPAAAEAGITPCTTTAAVDVVGITLDTATYVTAQQTDGTSARRVVSVVINPLAVYRYVMSGGAGDGTALAIRSLDAAQTDGLTANTGDDWSSPEMDGGTIWGYDGANAGQFRKITGTSTTTATVTVAFDYDGAIGDNYLYGNFNFPADEVALTAQFNTSLTQVDSQSAVGSDAAVTYVDAELYDLSGDGRTKSAVHFMSADHVFNLLT